VLFRKSILFPAIFIALNCYSQIDSVFYTSVFGDFSDAASISSSRGEFIFVSDAGTNKIFKYDINGKLLLTYGGTGLGKYELNQPVSIDATNGLDVFVTDRLNNRIVRLDNKLNLISIFEFSIYNTQSENSKKIFNPSSITTISSGELFILCDAGNYKAIRLKEFNDIDLFFCQSYDMIGMAAKIIKGISLDVWILDNASNELLNFNNMGIFVKRVNLPEKSVPVSFANIDKYIAIIFESMFYLYDIESSRFAGAFFLPEIKKIKDISFINDKTFMVLSNNRVYFFKLNQ